MTPLEMSIAERQTEVPDMLQKSAKRDSIWPFSHTGSVWSGKSVLDCWSNCPEQEYTEHKIAECLSTLCHSLSPDSCDTFWAAPLYKYLKTMHKW